MKISSDGSTEFLTELTELTKLGRQETGGVFDRINKIKMILKAGGFYCPPQEFFFSQSH
jgi:hypothetical protein